MSKAEEQKIERMTRKKAIDKMTAVVFAEIQKHLKNCQNKTSITIQTGPNGRHRYFTIKSFKQMIKISIYNDGNVNVVLEEPVYGEVEIPLIQYEKVEDVDSAIAQMKDSISVFCKEFFTGGLHQLLAFMRGCDIKTEWKECLTAYKEYLKECR